VLALIAFAVLNYLPTILILTSFISVLVVITRSYRDSEMVVWFASGQSLTRWIAPVLTFGLPIVILVAVISLVAIPWAQLKSNEFTERFEKREDLQRVAPGQFRESAAPTACSSSKAPPRVPHRGAERVRQHRRPRA
jgi:lipopolysaccharide export system permease protein